MRTKEEGGGMMGHHGSKAAANMVGKLLANEINEFYDQGITVAMINVRVSVSHSEADFTYTLIVGSLDSCALA